MRRNKYDEQEKYKLKISRDLKEVYKEIYNIKPIELSKKIRHGYISNWKLRADIAKRQDAKWMLQAIEASNIQVWSDNKQFIAQYKYLDYLEGTVEVISNHKKGYKVKIYPGKRKLSTSKYEALHPAVKKYFTPKEHFNKWAGTSYMLYHLNLTYQLVEDIQIYYITHKKLINPELESRVTILWDENRLLHYNSRFRSINEFRITNNRVKWRKATRAIIKNEDYDVAVENSILTKVDIYY